MLAALCREPDPSDPLAAVVVADVPRPARIEPEWTTVSMRAASLNMRDIGTARGIGTPAHRYPMILGSDGAGVLPDGREVVLHCSVGSPGWTGPEINDPGRTVLSEWHQGTYAETAVVPLGNAVPKPPQITFEEAACLPTAWLTAYRMLFVTAKVVAGERVLVRGRRGLGSIAGALIQLASAAGIEVLVVGDPDDDASARRLGASGTITDPTQAGSGVAATFDASISAGDWFWSASVLRPGGAMVCAGYRAHAGPESMPAVDPEILHHIIFREIRVLGSGMGTADDLASLLDFLVTVPVRPPVALTLPLTAVASGMTAMLTGRVRGKIVFTP